MTTYYVCKYNGEVRAIAKVVDLKAYRYETGEWVRYVGLDNITYEITNWEEIDPKKVPELIKELENKKVSK